MNFTDVFQNVQQNHLNHKGGYYNCIPFEGMERFERFIPGVEQATTYLLTASSGVGKSKLARYLFVHTPMNYASLNPEITVDIFYFSLEESKEKIILSEISKHLYKKHGLIVSGREILSKGKHNSISDDTLNKIRESEEYVNGFLKRVNIFDDIKNPTGIYKKMRDHALEIGTYYGHDSKPLSKGEVENIRTGQGNDFKKVSYYKTHLKRHFVIVLTDHISLLQPEKEETLWQTMYKFSSNYSIHLRDKYGFTNVLVQQQTSSKEQVQYNFRGDSIHEKLEPSLDGLADMKLSQRDANVVLGLFAPDRYGIPEHEGFDIDFFQDNYRSISIMKDRDGISNKKLPTYFNGAVDYFRELPKPSDLKGMSQVQAYLTKQRQLTKT